MGELMVEPSSPIAEYYPNDFESDANGKRQPWEAVVKVPFIDGDKLLGVVNGILDADENADTEEKRLLTNAERRRNILGISHTFTAPKDGAIPMPKNPSQRQPASKNRRMPKTQTRRTR